MSDNKFTPNNYNKPLTNALVLNYLTDDDKEVLGGRYGWIDRDILAQTLYRRYLDSPEWQAKRALVFKRCNDTCEGCGKTYALEVHHITYDHLGNELMFELLALCRICHERVHNRRS